MRREKDEGRRKEERKEETEGGKEETNEGRKEGKKEPSNVVQTEFLPPYRKGRKDVKEGRKGR